MGLNRISQVCSLSLSFFKWGRVSITLDIREILSSKVFSELKGTKEMRWRARLAKVVRLVGMCEQLACFITRLSLIAPSRIEPVPTRAKVTEIHLDTLPPLWTTWNWNVSGMAEVFTRISGETHPVG